MIRRAVCRWSALIVLMVCVCGCDPVPSAHEFSVPQEQTLVATPSSSDHYRWPVVDKEWQATKPTDFAFLRQIKRGEIGQVIESMDAKNRDRMARAADSQTEPPWMLGSTGLRGEALTNARFAIDESDAAPIFRESVKFPVGATAPTVWIDNTARHFVLSGKSSLWISRLPWRPWWAPPGMPPTEFDEAGDVNDFTEVALSSSSDTGMLIGFFGIESNGSDSRCMVACSNELHLVDCNDPGVVASYVFDEPIRHISVAKETGHTVVVDQGGKLFLTDPQLKRVSQVSEVDLELPMPAISPEAARIATYQTKGIGQVYNLTAGAVTHDIKVTLANAGEPLAIRSSRAYDLWIEKNAVHKRPHYPRQSGDELKSFRASLYWDLIDVRELHILPQDCFQMCIAERPTNDGNRERVLFDAVLGDRKFYRPISLERFDGKRLAVSASGNLMVSYDDQKADLYFRVISPPQGLSFLTTLADRWAYEKQFDDLESLASVIRALPEDRFHRTKEEVYYTLVHAVANRWLSSDQVMNSKTANAENVAAARNRYNAFVEWSKADSTLSLVTQMRYHAFKAWAARGGGWANTVSPNGWTTFESENERALEIWNKLSEREDVPAIAYDVFIQVARDTGMAYEATQSEVKDYLYQYPLDGMLHRTMMKWRLERWGGTRRSGSSYAGAVAKAIGAPAGDYIYFRCIDSVQSVFPYAFFKYAHVDAQRVLAGIRHGIDQQYFQEQSTASAIILVAGSHSRADAPSNQSPYAKNASRLCEELAEYYRQRYPMRVKNVVRQAGYEGYQRMLEYLPE